MKRVGIVGLGKMGSAMARNLLERGYRVSVWNRSPEPAKELAALGAVARESPETLVQGVDTVITMLWDDNVAREVSLGRVIPAARKPQIVIETSTLSPQMYETLAKTASARQVDFLAAPVVGSVDAAGQGSLTIFAGGEQATFERARDILDSLGSTVTFTGSPTASAYLKLVSNTVLGIGAAAWGELLAMCERAGVDRRLVMEALVRAFGRVASGKTQQLLDRDTEPRFSLDALLRDLRLSREAAQRVHVSVPILENILPQFESAAAKGLGERDYIALALALEEAASPASSGVT
jgi:3-hydroxyisobutyrate dehydrogenase-like beta-hydroxyacid dehydrogenase